MSTPSVSLSKYFTQKNDDQCLQASSKNISPLFFKIYKSGKLRGYLLGSCHSLTLINRTFDDAKDIFAPNSQVRKCFLQATVYVGELDLKNLSDPRDITDMVSRHQSIDGAMYLDAMRHEKKCEGLETLDDQEVAMKAARLPPAITKQRDCEKLVVSSFVAGSEKLTGDYFARCFSKEQQREHSKRNEKMANRIDEMLQKDENIFFTIGIYHLPRFGERSEEKGVCDLLRDKGYRVERA